MIRNATPALLSYIIICLLPIVAAAQIASEETASNFVNFNLNGINRVRSYLPEYNGSGTTVSIKEFRYDSLDIDFSGRHIPDSRAAGITTAHSTLMATVIAGGGNSFFTGKGTAWAANLTSSSFENIFPDPNEYFQQLNISVQNHSYGIDSIENFYGPQAAAYDLQAVELPNLLHVFSIGNRGNESPVSGPFAGLPGFGTITGEFKIAKNILTMGVVDSFGIIDPLSSHGPAFDGRIKPELVGFGIDGTSPAAALASGGALLLQQAYWEENGTLPPAALVKALLINGARDLGPAGVDHRYGYGNLDVFRSLQTLLAGHYLSDTIAFDERKQHQLAIPEHVAQLKITLVWSDPPASIHTEKALVNDLDLELISPTGSIRWLPQVLSSHPHPDSLRLAATTGKDHINNIEQIVLDRPEAGTYTIDIEAFNFGVATQTYQLVYEWDTLESFRWLFPTRDNQIVKNSNFLEQLYWESSNAPAQSGQLSISYDGITWAPIASGIDLSAGNMQWSPPDTTSRARLKMQIGNRDYLSDTFTLSQQPFLEFVLNCADSIAVRWDKQAGIDQYRFYRLSDRYFEPFLLTGEDFLTISKADLPRPYIAFAPVLPGGTEGIRSLAYNLDQQIPDCYFQRFTGTIVGEAALFDLVLSTDYGVTSISLERSEAGQFQTLSTIQTSGGTQFELEDPAPVSGTNHYRARITLSNGAVLYSDTVSLNFILPNQFKIYPNPISRQGDFQLEYNVTEPERVRFEVFTAPGARIFSLSLPELETFLFADDFQAGLYFYRFVKDGQLLQSGKLVVR